jgi:hypothetical protein
MKLSSTWFALILIASALCLSAADTEINVQQNPLRLTENRNSQTNENEEHAQTTIPLAQHSAPATNTPTNQPTADNAGGSPNHSDGLLRMVGTVISSQVFFNTFLTVATIFIAIFNYQLLLLNRPILVADRPTPGFFSPKEREKAFEEGKVFFVTSAKCPFRNVGQSPAILLKIAVRMKLGRDLALPPNFDDCGEETAFRIRSSRPVLNRNSSRSIRATNLPTRSGNRSRTQKLKLRFFCMVRLPTKEPSGKSTL